MTGLLPDETRPAMAVPLVPAETNGNGSGRPRTDRQARPTSRRSRSVSPPVGEDPAQPTRSTVTAPPTSTVPTPSMPVAAAEVARAASTDASPHQLRILASATFTGGSPSLRIGERYILALGPGRLEVRGPIDVDPDLVVVQSPIDEIDVIGVSDGLLVTDRHQRADRIALSFVQVKGRTPEGVEQLVAIEQKSTSAGRGSHG